MSTNNRPKFLLQISTWIVYFPSSPLLFHPFLSDYLTLKRYSVTRQRTQHQIVRTGVERVTSTTHPPPLIPRCPSPGEHEERRVREHPTTEYHTGSCGFRQGDEVCAKPARLPDAAIAPNIVVQLHHPATFHSPAFDSPSPPMLTT